jgi:hypothetical protein
MDQVMVHYLLHHLDGPGDGTLDGTQVLLDVPHHPHGTVTSLRYL